MTLWRVLEILSLGIGLCLGGAAGLLMVSWLLAYAGRKWGTDDIPMGRTIVKFAQADEQLPARAAKRRERVEAQKKDAAHVSSGGGSVIPWGRRR